MSKRKFGVEGFGIARQATYNFEPAAGHRRLYIPSPPRPSQHDNYEDHDLDDIDYEDDDDGRNAAAAHSSDWKARIHGGKERQEEDEIDPLDAFMEGIHEEVNRAPAKKETGLENLEDEEEEDPTESFLKARKDTALALAADALHAGYDSDEEVYAAARAVDAANNATLEYDSDDNLIVDRKKIEPLPPLNHSEIDYSLFNRDFYEEMPSISEMSAEDVASYRQSLAIRVSGFDVPRPIKSFEDLGFDKLLMGAICKHDYKRPTPIQCQGLPVALSGRDMLGIAKTGSGKTAAFILPMIVHIMDQEELDEGEGPIAVICAPTRELAQQIYTEAKKFAKVHAIRISAIYGGMSKYEQCKELKAGCEVVVATPGRLIDMLKAKALTLLRTTYLVLDEADRMFDLGFEPQIRSIVGQIRPDRQTLLFSATMPRKVERLAREILSDPVRVTVGEVGSANEDITQLVTVLPSDVEKIPWLLNRLTELVDEGDVLVFASTKVKIQEIESQLNEIGFKVAALHGDMDQASRMEVLQKFKSGIYHVLVATDVAARGLDIKSIKSVVNFDIAKDIDGHVHRIGRTGRAGDKDGVAYTLITQKEARFAGDLVNCLIAAGQNVTTELMDLAMKDSHFRARHEERRGGKKAGGKGQGKGRTRGKSVRGVDFGLGLGYKPETGSKSSAPSARTETQNRGTAVNALKMGMMARFKSNFVAASSGNIAGSGSFTSAADLNKNAYPSRAMSGFVSSGTLASVTPQNHEVSVSGRAMSGFVTSGTLASVTQNHEVSSGGRLVSGSGTEKDRSQDGQRRWDPNFGPYSSETDRDNRERNNSREHQREKRRSSGWDR